MNIIIAGAGAMGSRFGIMLKQAGENVILIDGWQDHIDAINKSGLKADFDGREVTEFIPAYNKNDLSQLNFSADLVILFTKALDLDNMLQSIKKTLHENTMVLCLLNGMGYEDIIKKYVPYDNIFIGNTMWTASLDGPGKVTLFGDGSVALQNLSPTKHDMAEKIATTLSHANLNAKVSKNILATVYRKACVNGTLNCLCTILDSNVADFGDTKPALPIIKEIVSEFLAVAKHEEIYLDEPDIIEQITRCFNRGTVGLHHPSMYQDLIIKHRLTEIDYINGAVVRKGLEYNIPTPYCKLLTQLVHSKEELLQAK